MVGPDRKKRVPPAAAGGKRPFYQRLELYLPLIVIGGIVVAVLVFVKTMYAAGWQPATKTTATIASAFVGASAPPIVLYASPTTRAFMTKVSAGYDVLLQPWRDYLTGHKRRFREVSDPEELAKHSEGAVILLPSAFSLSDAERKVLLEHQRKGGSILATGAIGARDGGGTWVGWDLVGELFGVRVADDLSSTGEEAYLVTVADSPLTMKFPAGERFWVGKMQERPLRFEGGQVAARLMDWARTPTANLQAASVVYGEKGPGRWVLFGFAENAWDPAPTPMGKLADGALDWLQRQPKAVLAPWPNGYSAAHMVSMNIDQAAENALDLLATLDVLKMRGTFFVVSDAAAKAPDVIKAISAGHEIAHHGDVYRVFKDEPEVEQKRRLMDMQQKRLVRSLWPMTTAVTGFRAPGESYDAKTERILHSLGLRYHAVEPARSEARVPLFSEVKQATAADDLVVLPRTQRDDVGILMRPGATLDETVSSMKGELSLVREQGALGVLSVHTRNFAKDGMLGHATAAYLLALAGQRDQVWIATGKDLADWWRARSNVRVSLNVIGLRHELEVSNLGKASVEGATAIIYHPRSVKVILSPTKAWQPSTTVKRIDDLRSQVVFGSVGSGHYAYTVSFE